MIMTVDWRPTHQVRGVDREANIDLLTGDFGLADTGLWKCFTAGGKLISGGPYRSLLIVFVNDICESNVPLFVWRRRLGIWSLLWRSRVGRISVQHSIRSGGHPPSWQKGFSSCDGRRSVPIESRFSPEIDRLTMRSEGVCNRALEWSGDRALGIKGGCRRA